MDLWDALELDGHDGTPVVAVVGGGGKSSLMYRLGLEAVARHRTAVIGGTTRFTGPTPPFPPLPRIEVPDDSLAEALEADGSKLRSFKAPADHEPVVPPSATHVCAVVGLDVLGEPLDEAHVHRPERGRAIVGDQPIVTPEVIAAVLASEQGGRRAVGDRVYAAVINKADLDLDAARAVATAVRDAGVERVLVTSLRSDDAVYEDVSALP